MMLAVEWEGVEKKNIAKGRLQLGVSSVQPTLLALDLVLYVYIQVDHDISHNL